MSLLFDDISRVIASEFPRRKMLGMLGAAVGARWWRLLACGLKLSGKRLQCPSAVTVKYSATADAAPGPARTADVVKNMRHCGFECCGADLLCCNGHCCTCKTAVCFRGFCCESGVICAGRCCELQEFCVDGKCRRVISPTQL